MVAEKGKEIILVVKRPRSDPIPDKPIKFVPLQNLHLELMENKKKLKPGLPPVQIIKNKPNPAVLSKENGTTKPLKPKNPEFIEIPSNGVPKQKTISKPALPLKKPQKEVKPPVKKETLEEEDFDDEEEFDDEEGDEEDFDDEEDFEEEGNEEDLEEEEKPPPKNKPKQKNGTIPKEAKSRPKVEDELEGLKEDTKPSKIEEKESDIESNIDNETLEDEPGQDEGELDESDDEYAGLTPEERLARETQEYVWRFRILKKKYKHREIPSYNEHDDLTMMKSTYDRTVREIVLDENIEQYKTYLIGGFFALEYVGVNLLDIDFEGFANQQIKMMNRYESVLVELGERSYNRWGMNLPVEVRLLGFIILQAGIFYLAKVLTASGGGTVSELFKAFTGQPPTEPKSSAKNASTSSKEDPEEGEEEDSEKSEPEQKKMRGPSLKAKDIRNKKKNEHKEEKVD